MTQKTYLRSNQHVRVKNIAFNEKANAKFFFKFHSGHKKLYLLTDFKKFGRFYCNKFNSSY